MNRAIANSWQAVQETIRERIRSREWHPGDLIPNEIDLANELGCARATINRALQGLADEGILERKRKVGTRVALTPVRLAKFEIPIIRQEIEYQGLKFSYMVLHRENRLPPPNIRAKMRSNDKVPMLYLETLYTANANPYMYESRWINLKAVPSAKHETFTDISPNEWLVQNVPFDGGDFTFSAITANKKEAEILSCPIGTGLLVLQRTTLNGDLVNTSVKQSFYAGYQMHTEI